MSEMNDELKLIAAFESMVKPMETALELLKHGKNHLQRQQFQIDNNHLQIVDQQKQIAENKVLIEGAKKTASDIIALAEAKAKEMDANSKTRMIQVSHLEREAKKNLEDSQRTLFNSKKPVEA